MLVSAPAIVERSKLYMKVDDIRIAVDFWEHPKTRKLELRLGLSAVKALIKLWMWAANNRPDGDLSKLDDEDLIIASGWSADGDFISALSDLKWLDGAPHQYKLHEWNVHNPWAAGAEYRSGAGRLLKLAQANKDAYDKLIKQGVESITKEQFTELAYRRASRKRSAKRTASDTQSVTPALRTAPSSKFQDPRSEFQDPDSKLQDPSPDGEEESPLAPLGKKSEAMAKSQASKTAFGENGFVLLTEDEKVKLDAEYGQTKAGEAIAYLDLHIGAKGKDPYKSHYLAMKKWVFDAVQERSSRRQAARASPLTNAERKQSSTVNAVREILEEIANGD